MSAPITQGGHNKLQVTKEPPNNLGEVSNEVAAGLISSSQHIEMKRLDVVVERLVIEEEFRQQTKVLTIDL